MKWSASPISFGDNFDIVGDFVIVRHLRLASGVFDGVWEMVSVNYQNNARVCFVCHSKALLCHHYGVQVIWICLALSDA